MRSRAGSLGRHYRLPELSEEDRQNTSTLIQRHRVVTDRSSYRVSPRLRRRRRLGIISTVPTSGRSHCDVEPASSGADTSWCRLSGVRNPRDETPRTLIGRLSRPDEATPNHADSADLSNFIRLQEMSEASSERIRAIRTTSADRYRPGDGRSIRGVQDGRSVTARDHERDRSTGRRQT